MYQTKTIRGHECLLLNEPISFADMFGKRTREPIPVKIGKETIFIDGFCDWQSQSWVSDYPIISSRLEKIKGYSTFEISSVGSGSDRSSGMVVHLPEGYTVEYFDQYKGRRYFAAIVYPTSLRGSFKRLFETQLRQLAGWDYIIDKEDVEHSATFAGCFCTLDSIKVLMEKCFDQNKAGETLLDRIIAEGGEIYPKQLVALAKTTCEKWFCISGFASPMENISVISNRNAIPRNNKEGQDGAFYYVRASNRTEALKKASQNVKSNNPVWDAVISRL